MSLISSLYTGASGIYANQTAVDVTGNNISNVNTEGYSREVVNLSSSTTIEQKGLLLGTGITVGSVTRAGDTFIISQLIAASGDYGTYEAASEPLAELEQILDIDESGLSTDIDEFFDSWEALSINPDESTERQQVIAEAQDLVDKFHQLDQELADVVESINASIESRIPEVNNMLEQVAELNHAIHLAESTGKNANTLEDSRDLLVQEISESCGASSYVDENGMICLQLNNGLPLVTGNIASSFSAERVNGLTMLTLEAGSSSYSIEADDIGGGFNGLLDVRDNVIPELQDDIDRLAYEIATGVNTLLSGGIDTNGNPGADLFSLTPPTDPLADPWEGASPSITLSFDDPDLLAAGATGGSADNSVCLDIVELYNTETIDGSTYSEEYARIAAVVGQLVSSNEDKLLASEDNLEETLANRDEISGVSTDEEMLMLVQYQTGYEAAASFLSTVKEMLAVMLEL